MAKRVIVSLHDKPVTINVCDGTFKIPARDPVKGYATLVIEDRITQWLENYDRDGRPVFRKVQPCVTVTRTDMGDKRGMPEPKTTEDVVAEINRTQGDLIRTGLFVAAGDVPTDAELRAARNRRTQWQRELIIEADAAYATSRNPTHINSNAHAACAELGIAKEWAVGADTNVTKRCIKCAEVIQAQAVRCRHCGYDMEEGKSVPVPPVQQSLGVQQPRQASR